MTTKKKYSKLFAVKHFLVTCCVRLVKGTQSSKSSDIIHRSKILSEKILLSQYFIVEYFDFIKTKLLKCTRMKYVDNFPIIFINVLSSSITKKYLLSVMGYQCNEFLTCTT